MNSVIVIVAILGCANGMATPPQNLPFLGPLLSSTPLVTSVTPVPAQIGHSDPFIHSGPVSYSGPVLHAVPVVHSSPLVSSGPAVPYAHRTGYTSTENFQTPNLAKSEIRDDSGQYSLSYITSNGIRVNERTILKLGPNNDYIPVKEGTYQYISPEGVPVSYGYKADENGFVVRGFPLPVAP